MASVHFGAEFIMANYAFVENNVITGLYDNLPTNWQNVSNFYLLKDDIETLSSMGWKVVQKVEPTYNSNTQYLGSVYHRLIDDQVIETFYVVDKPIEPEIISTEPTEQQLLEKKIMEHNQAMQELRAKRNELLANTDFTQLSDVIEMNGVTLSQAYKDYRQALRNLPNTYETDVEFVNSSTATYPVLSDFIVQPTPTESTDNGGV